MKWYGYYLLALIAGELAVIWFVLILILAKGTP